MSDKHILSDHEISELNRLNEDGWDEIERSVSAADEATLSERARCEVIVRDELERGRARGVPETAGVMLILHRIAAAISNG